MASVVHKNLIRLHIDCDSIQRTKTFGLSEGQVHYLRNVMRLKEGDQLRVFNGRDGEWLAQVDEINKKNVIISFLDKLREQEKSADVWVVASPVKKEAFDMMVEKSAELGASRFVPAVCDHTVVHRVNHERLEAVATEAAEQCERLDLMEVSPLANLKTILNSWPSGRRLMFCLERGKAPPIVARLSALPKNAPLAVLVGPEGGFSEEEVRLISACPFAEPVSLGPRILKAETAVIAALSCLQLIVNN